jgi:hypothetical protein
LLSVNSVVTAAEGWVGVAGSLRQPCIGKSKYEEGENAARDFSSIIITRSSNRSIGKPL